MCVQHTEPYIAYAHADYLAGVIRFTQRSTHQRLGANFNPVQCFKHLRVRQTNAGKKPPH
jgi:hypothetical protein